MYDISAIGDILVDFTPIIPKPTINDAYEANAGGTIANMCAAAGALGLNVFVSGKVGNDPLGHMIVNKLEEANVDVSGCVFDDIFNTTQTFVTLANGERSFSFIRRHAADINLQIGDVQLDKLLDSKILHFSGMCLTDEPVRATTFMVLQSARERGVTTSLDVNYRDKLWQSEDEMIKYVTRAIAYTDIYKSSEEEILLLTGESNLKRAAETIIEMGAKIVFVSCGHKGAFYYYQGDTGFINTYDTKPVDTTGAGDCFMAAINYQIISRGGLENVAKTELDDILKFANAAGAQSITKRGGVSSMPSVSEIETCMKQIPVLEIPYEV